MIELNAEYARKLAGFSDEVELVNDLQVCTSARPVIVDRPPTVQMYSTYAGLTVYEMNEICHFLCSISNKKQFTMLLIRVNTVD